MCDYHCMWSAEDDAAVRREAMSWLAAWTNDGLDAISNEELGDFRFRGEKFRLKDTTKGIWKPAVLPAAMSIVTTYRAPGKERPYQDEMGPDGLMRYKWQGDDPELHANRALRAAMRSKLPLIWFWGAAPGVFKPIFPVFIVGEEPHRQQFIVATDGLQNIESTGLDIDEVTKRYALQETKRRLHQPVFRGLVMHAYGNQCAVCAIRHSPLLDAAHIVPDSEDDGLPAVRNGMALCKIHHAAYDAGIIGVDSDYVVEVREDILEEVDGPMLEYGVKELHQKRLRVFPSARKERPDPELLDRQFAKFKAGRVGRRYRVDMAALSANSPLRSPHPSSE